MSKKAVSTAANIGSPFASSIIYPYNRQASLFQRLYTRLATGYYLSNIKNTFLDFDPKEFPTTAMRFYSAVQRAHSKKNKSDLHKLLTQPNYEILNHCSKSNLSLPFEIHPVVKSAEILQAHIVSEQNDSIDINNFAQVTVRIVCEDKHGQEVDQISVWERRLDVKSLNAWKMALLEDNLE